MTSEYETLRTEIKDWQDRRFTILTASIGIVTAVLGIKIFDQPARLDLWPWISALLLLLLSSACVLTWYAARANAKIAAYIMVFHEDPSSGGWESRLHQLKTTGLDRLNLNRLIICIYFLLGVVSVLLPAFQHPPNSTGWAIVGAATIVFLLSLLLLLFRSPKARYLDEWNEIKRQNAQHRNA